MASLWAEGWGALRDVQEQAIPLTRAVQHRELVDFLRGGQQVALDALGQQRHRIRRGGQPTGDRHCLNSVSLGFPENGSALPDLLQRGAPEGQPDAGD